MQAAKETASNISASAKAGMDKTNAVAQEKVDKMKTSDPGLKQMAEQKKIERIREAELEKQRTQQANAVQKEEAHHGTAGQHHIGLTGPTGGLTTAANPSGPTGGLATAAHPTGPTGGLTTAANPTGPRTVTNTTGPTGVTKAANPTDSRTATNPVEPDIIDPTL